MKTLNIFKHSSITCKAALSLIVLACTLSVAAQGVPLPGDAIPEANDSRESLYDFSGYIENTTGAENSKADDALKILNTTRARVNVEGRPNSHTDFALSLVGNLYSGNTTVSLLDYFPDEQAREASLPEAYMYEYENDLMVQEAFASLYLGDFMIRAGRQKYYTGTGYAYNPSDLFNTKNPLDPNYEYDGLDLLLVSAALPQGFDFDCALRAGDEARHCDVLAYLTGYAGYFSFGVQYSSLYREAMDYAAFNRTDVEAALLSGDSSVLDPAGYMRHARWHYGGAELSGEINAIHLYAEGGYVLAEADGSSGEHESIDTNHERFLLGVDYTFDMQLYVIAEYLRYGLGNERASDISFSDRAQYYEGEHLSLAKNTLFSGASYPVTDLSELGLYTIYSVDIASVIINPRYSLDVAEGAQLDCNLQIPAGDEDAVGKNGAGGFLRLKLSF